MSREIELMDLLKKLWSSRKLIIISVFLSAVFGAVVSFLIKSEFEATARLLPEVEEEGIGSGDIGGLANLAGINLSGFGDKNTLTPELYPQITRSLPFVLKLWEEPLQVSGIDSAVTSKDYFMSERGKSPLGFIYKYTLGLPAEISKAVSKETSALDEGFADSSYYSFSLKEEELLNQFKDRITVQVDRKTGIVTLSAKFPDPLAAAQLANKSIQYLTEYVVNYKLAKAQRSLDFIEERQKEARIQYLDTQNALAEFNDRNLVLSTAFAQTEQRRLENENDLAFELFRSLSTQMERARIKVKEQTPIFAELDPVVRPNLRVKPNRKMVVIVFAFMGFLFSSFVILTLDGIKNFYKNLNN